MAKINDGELIIFMGCSLEKICDACEGSGVWEKNKEYSCPVCHATGIAPTDEGKKLLFFMARHFPNLRKEMTA